MPFIYLLLFALICLQTQWPSRPDWLTSVGCAMLVGTLMLASWLSAGLIGEVLGWQLTRHPEQRSLVLRRYNRWRRFHFIALLAIYLAVLYLLGWGHVLADFLKDWLPATWQAEGNLPGYQLGLLAPFFIGLVLAWERFYQVEKTAFEQAHEDERYLGRLSYLLLQVRHQFFIVLPPIFVMTLLQVMYLFFAGYDQQSALVGAVMGSVLVASFITMPIVLRLFLGLKPLPAGPLRDRLEATARRLGFRYSNVLVWHTRNLFANAMVTGFVPWIRYIVLTDRLIDELTPEEIEAVFGHEIGHIKHHHLLFYLAFFMTSITALGIVWEGAAQWLDQVGAGNLLASFIGLDLTEDLILLTGFLKLGLLSAYMLLFFGYLSRRCERQADLFGAGAVSTDTFISALEKVADINGIDRRRFSWLHPSIAQRVEFLQAMRDQPHRVPGFQLSMRLMQWSLYGALGMLMFLMWNFELLDVRKLLLEF